MSLNSAKNFRKAFDHLSLPITTANHGLVKNWKPIDVWNPFWATVKDYYRQSPLFRELIEIVFQFDTLESTYQHRSKLQSFVNRNISGYQLIFEADLLDAINSCFEKSNSHERILGFKYGKDGRGAMPDRYYQLLFSNKYLVVGNHHDILGHLILLCDPVILSTTERLARGFSESLENYHNLKVASGMKTEDFDRNNIQLRRINQLYTLAWNLCQEKLYIEVKNSKDQPSLSLIGAFNSVYNTIFDPRIGPEQVPGVAGALGFFNRTAERSILMPPTALDEFCQPMGAFASPEAKECLTNYRNFWLKLNLPDEPKKFQDLSARMETIVKTTLFDRGFFKNNIETRWQKFSQALLSDRDFQNVFNRENLIQFANLKIALAESTYRHLKSLSISH